MQTDKRHSVNEIADDWLLLYPNTYKADLVSALSKFDKGSLEEIYSFHERIKSLPATEKRKILEELPEAYRLEIQHMLEAYSRKIERANEDYL